MENDKDCKCLSELSEKIKLTVCEKESKTKGFEMHDSDWQYKTWYPKVRLYVNYVFKYTFEKANGQRSKEKNGHVTVCFTYCPFCGKKYEKV